MYTKKKIESALRLGAMVFLTGIVNFYLPLNVQAQSSIVIEPRYLDTGDLTACGLCRRPNLDLRMTVHVVRPVLGGLISSSPGRTFSLGAVPANTRDVVVPRLVIPTAVFESEIAAAIAKDADRVRRVFDRSPPQAHLVMELILINTRTMAPGQRLGRRYILLPTAAPLSAFNSPILTEIVAKSGENEMDTTNAEDFTGTILELRIQNAQPAN